MLTQRLLYLAYGWLFASGLLHYAIDVVSQYLRGVRQPGPLTTLYYGLHTAYSVGQMAFAGLALLVLWSGSDLLSRHVGFGLSIVAVAAWLVVSIVYSEYTPPRVNAAIVLALLVGAFLVS